MVNFKYFGLPLLVGLIYSRKASAGECTFTYTGEEALTSVTATDCNEVNNGYHYVVHSSVTKHRMINYNYNGTPQITDATAGLYKINTKYYLCTSATVCTDKTSTLTTVGYYKFDNQYVKCSSSNDSGTLGTCEKIETPTETCGESTVGKFVLISGSNYGLCLAEYGNEENKKYISLKFGSDNPNSIRYLVKHIKKENNDNRVFNFNKKKNYYVVKRTENSIVFDSTANEAENCASITNGAIISRKQDFCEGGVGKYFTCNNGVCTSALKSNRLVIETNGEDCTLIAGSSPIQYSGNCVSGDYYYLINNENNILNSSSSTGRIINLNENFKVIKNITDIGYYINADVNTKEENPLITCNGDNCGFVKLEDIKVGYYITAKTGNGSFAVQCTTNQATLKKICTDVTILSSNTDCDEDNVGNLVLKSDTVDICTSESTTKVSFDKEVSKEYLLLNVNFNAFPGVTTAGNYAVKMERADSDIGTISLVEKNTSCTEDNEIIKDKFGNFKYCAGGVEVPMKDGGAKFVISINSAYKIVKIGKTGITYDDTVGYFVDRSEDSNALIYCEKTQGTSKRTEVHECNSVSINWKDNYEVFINSEEGFPGSNAENPTLTAKLIVCNSEKCEIPEISSGKYVYNEHVLDPVNYFINHQDDKVQLIKCTSSIDVCEEKIEFEEGFYINGIQNHSLFKCTKEEDESGNDIFTWDTLTDLYIGYFNSHDSANYIICDSSSCTESVSTEDQWFVNGDEDDSDHKIISCTGSDPHICEVILAGDYYIDSSKSDGMNLIKCVENVCSKVDGTDRGVYISDNGEHLIKCSNNDNPKCEVIPDIEPDKSKYYMNGDSEADNPIITGIEKEEEDKNQRRRKRATKIVWGTPEELKPFSIFKNENNVDNYGIIYCISENKCSEIFTAKYEKYIDIINKKLFTCDSGSPITCTSNNIPGDDYIVLVDKSNGKIATGSTEVGSLLTCKKESNEWSCDYQTSGLNYYIDSADSYYVIVSGTNGYTRILGSSMTEGYYINSDNNIIKCESGSGCSGVGPCTLDCSSGNIGSIKVDSGVTLCIGYDTQEQKPISVSSAGKYMIKPNSFPGYTAGSYAFINYEEDKITLIKPSIKSYYLIGEGNTLVTGNTDEGTVYNCETDGKCSEVEEVGKGKAISSSLTKYYPNSDEKTLNNYPLIKCENVETEEPMENGKVTKKYNYVCKLSDNSDNEYCYKSSGLALCIKDCSATATCSTIVGNVGYYLPYEKNYLIRCEGNNSCSKKNYPADIKEGYYKGGDANHPLIICNKSAGALRCSYVKKVNDGYYIGPDQGSNSYLIKCKNNVCIDEVVNEGYYVGAESTEILITCDSEKKCKGIPKPDIGYYINKGSGGKLLIKCYTSNSNSLKCEDMDPLYNKYFISAEDDKKLINCTSGSECVLYEGTSGYYINGENSKLIYCDPEVKCDKTEINGWIIKDTHTLIYCNGNCEEKNNVKKGFYLNADPNTYIKPLIKVDTTADLLSNVDIKSGWYLNSEKSTGTDDRVIECVGGIIPVCNKISAQKSKVNGKFYEENNEVNWYINDKLEYFTKTGTRDIYAEYGSKTSLYYIKYEISEYTIIQKKVDGYSYDESTKTLFKCNGYGNGYCSKIKNDQITPGYYINYTEGKLIICNYDKDSMVCTNVENPNNCDSYNVIKTSGKFELCTRDDHIYLNDFSENSIVDKLYVISQKNNEFPKKKDDLDHRYVLVYANKYYVKYIKGIEEISVCDEKKDETADEKLVCIEKQTNRLLKVATLTTLGVASSSKIEINMNNMNTKLVYGAQTNNGYYEYLGDGKLDRVFIKNTDGLMSRGKSYYKYDCYVNYECVGKIRDEEPDLGFGLSNNVIQVYKGNFDSSNSKRKRAEDESTAVEYTEKIMPGYYVIYKNNKKIIVCKDVNGIIQCYEDNVSGTGITFINSNTSIKVSGQEANTLYEKYIATTKTTKKRDGSVSLILKKLTSVSYVEVEFKEITNIFLDKNLKRITNDVISLDDEKEVTGYTCYPNGECKEINKTGQSKIYFLNTIQNGSPENAIVVCGKFESGNRCRFLRAEEGLIFENYAATSVNDAVITCTANGCSTSSASKTGKLPECQLDTLGNVALEESTNSCIRADTQKSLLDGQHCITKGVIYIYSNKSCEPYSDNKNIRLFDSTYRELAINNVFENHYGAILYSCPTVVSGRNVNCYTTFGYIAVEKTVNNEKTIGYSKCGLYGCIYNDINSLKSICSEVGEGALVNDNKVIRICRNGLEKSNISLTSSGEYAYLVNINANDNFPETIIGDSILVGVDYNNSEKRTVYYSIKSNGYIITTNNNNIKNTSSTDDRALVNPNIYYCDNGNCKLIINSNLETGYYRSDIYNKLFINVSFNVNNVKEIKYNDYSGIGILDKFDGVDNNNYKYYIENNFAGNSFDVIAEASIYKYVAIKTDNYVLLNTKTNKLATENDSLDKLYICNSLVGKCVEEKIMDGWYVSGQSGYLAIVCNGGNCSMRKTLNKSCSGEGDFIYSENTYQICIQKDKTVIKYKLSENIGKVSELISNNVKFPNEKTYIVVYANSVKGIGYRDVENNTTSSGIPTCKSVNTNGCVLSNNSKLELNNYCLYQNSIYGNVTESAVNSCKQQFTTGVSVELFVGSKKITEIKEDQKYGTQLMYCKNGNCRVTAGYKKIGSTWFKCDYGTCDQKYDKNNKIVGNLVGGKLTTTYDSEKSLNNESYFYIKGNNEFPGTNGIESFIIETNKDYAVQFIGNGYYLIDTKDGIMQTSDPKEATYSTNNKSTNRLYSCSLESKSCIYINGIYINGGKDTNNKLNGEAENKFYNNAGSSSPSKKSIIGCYNGDCKLANEGVTFDTTYDNCKNVGNLVRKTPDANANGNIDYDEYKICTTRNSSPKSLSITNGKSKYYMITLKRGDVFAGIEIKDEDANDEVERNIIVEVGDGYISQYEKEGYILYSSTTNEIINTVGSTKGALYYCSKSENYKNAKKYSYECKIESNINNGWYFNDIYGNNRVIRCIDGVCAIIDIKSSNKCVSSGSLIYNEGFKICQTLDKQINIESIKKGDEFDIIMNVKLLYDFPGLKTNNTEILLSVKQNAAYQVKMKNSYVVREDNVVITNNGSLYECFADGHCNKNYTPNDNYYIKSDNEGKDTELIICENRTCNVNKDDIGKPNAGNTEGFRVGANNKYPIIQCVKPGSVNNEGVFVESGIAICKEKEYKEGWYLNSGYDKKDKPLIECTKESGCVTKSPINDGWYINAGANSIYSKIGGVSYPIIECKSNVCEYYKNEIKKECTKGGEIVMPSSNTYKLCKNNEKTIEFSKSGAVEIVNNDGNNIIVKSSSTSIIKYNNGYYLKDNVMYECNDSCTAINSDDKDGIIVLESINKNLMTSTCSSGVCTWSSNNKEGNFFIDERKVLVTKKENEVNEIYECLRVNKNIECKEVLSITNRGYFFNTDIVDNDGKQITLLYICESGSCSPVENDVQSEYRISKCSELPYKSNYCYISYINEEYDIEGSEPIINAGEMCITESGDYYFAIDEINTGIDNANCVPIPTKDSTTSYYSVGNVLYGQNKFNTRAVGVNNVINGINNDYYYKASTNYELNSINGVLVLEGDNSIVCSNGKCENISKIVSCTYNFQNEKCSVTSGSVSAGQLCRSIEGNLYFALEKLSSSGGKCVNHNTGWNYSIGSSSVTPDYSNGKNVQIEKYESLYYVVDGKMYRIDEYDNISIMKEGVYLIDDANKKVDIAENSEVDISKESTLKLYICNSSGCKVKNSCNAGSNYEYIYDGQSAISNLIRCNPKTNTITHVYNDGYYVNTAWENLIRCINGKCIVYDKDIGMEGYYLDAGNKEKVIKCVREGTDSFKCISENIIPCTYEKDGTCQSDFDLLRNSYCYYVKKDKKGNDIGAPMMLYVEDFIRAKDIGLCKKNEGNDDYYYHYRRSKFLGNEEREEIIKFSKGSIVSIYEKELGYYIITTDTRMGVTEDIKLNKSRLYECTSAGCVEQKEPVNDRIYINKASTEKMIHYSDGYWKVKRNHCVKSKENINQCELPTTGFNAGDIIYLFEEGDLEPEFMTSWYDLKTKNTNINENNEKISTSKYQYYRSMRKMYVLNKNKQSFDVVDEDGYYMFNVRRNIPVENYYSNLEPFMSTVNSTIESRINLYRKNGGWSINNKFSFSEFTDGYYWNKADIDGEGIVIQVMNVPIKKETAEEVKRKRSDEEEKITKYKAVVNKCIINKKNYCQTTQDGQTIAKGGVCVVVEGENRGLYLAIDNISNNSSKDVNCIRGDNRNGYSYIGSKIEFAGEPLEKVIVEVTENNIKPFNKYSNHGYYVIDKNERKLLNSASAVSATGYKCGYEYDVFTEGDEIGQRDPSTENYECNPVTDANTYYRTKNGEVVFAKSASNWYIESKRGYYFFNEDYLAAATTVDPVDKEKIIIKDNKNVMYVDKNAVNIGTYLNSAINESKSYAIVQIDSSSKTLLTEYKLCNIISGENCKSADENVELSNGEICYPSNKNNLLYLVEVKELENGTKKYMCYTGGEKLKYRFINNKLYRLDGLSVQEVGRGYYILNDNWEEYSSTYPEIPNAVIYCDGSCEMINSVIDLNTDVIYNSAATGDNKFLRYYPNTGKFVNAYKPGYYLLNSRSEITKETGSHDYKYNGYLNEDGSLSGLDDFGFHNIYINNAKEGALTWMESEFENPKITYNRKTDRVEYDGVSVEEGEEIIYRIVDEYLYRQLPKSFVEVVYGLYAIKDDKPFIETEWTSLTNNKEICYYEGGYCNTSKLNLIKKQQYTINMATSKPTIIEYNSSSNTWRMVKEPGVYFFFEEGYSITSTDRRISKVYEIIEGEAIDITEDENRIGYYKFNNMMIESNEKHGWEDGSKLVESIETANKRVCNTYETNEIITSEKFCYNNDYGVCIPKLDISNINEENNANCIFSGDNSVYYFLNGNKLQSVSNQAYRNIKKSGLYVVDSNKKVYENKLESKAVAYDCNEDDCKINEELSTGYYLNMANGGIDKPSILYYNGDNKTWRKTTTDGYYIFNKNGYAISDGEEVDKVYKVENEGNDVYNMIESASKGIYINQSSVEDNIVVEYTSKWEKAKKVPGCKISPDGSVKSSEIMKVGDICIDDKKLVFISVVGEASKKRDDEYIYQGISLDGEESKYAFDSTNSFIVKLEEGNIVKLEITGYAIVDNKTNLSFNSKVAVEATIYKCDKGKCSSVDVSSIQAGTRYVNAISEEEPLVRYEGESKWILENEEGYYFFNSDSKVLSVGNIVYSAIAIKGDDDGNMVQQDITTSKELGLYLMKSSGKEVLVSNDEIVWSKGIELNKCNITEIETGFNCRTFKDKLDSGDYCYDGEKLFLLIAEATEDVEEANCISGSNYEPLYLTSEKVGVLNGMDVNKLVEIKDDSIKVVSPGIYILNVNGTIIDNNGKGDIEMQIYRCDEVECSKDDNVEKNVKFVAESNEVFEINEENVLVKVVNNGKYFFNDEGLECREETDVISSIVEISDKDEEVVFKSKALDEMSIGSYVNNANNKTLAVYDGKKWSIKESECNYNTETNSCTSETIDIEVGSYCIVEGKIYIITEIDEEKGINTCKSGNNESPLYMVDDENRLIAISENTISVVDVNGYYAINAKTGEGLSSETPIASKFIKCEKGGDCADVKPEKNSSYLNKSVKGSNIVNFNSKGSVKEVTTNETHCIVDDDNCSITEGELVVGDICIADNSLFLIKNEGKCIMAEKYIERYQFVNNKVYRLGDDVVVQMFDGYYFMNGDSRPISSVADYSNKDTIGYMCSIKGDCYEIDPSEVRYFKDYATEVDGKYKVIKYDPDKKTRRDEEGNSGYEAIFEGGVYKLDDGSYTECEIENNDEVDCNDIKEVGTRVTIDGEILICSKNESKEIECVQATEGGYYLIDDVLMECEATVDGDKLDCNEVKKEGYFLADGKNKVLYDCVEKVEETDINVSGLLGIMNNFEEITEDGNEIEEGILNDENIIEINKREETPKDGKEDASKEGEEGASKEGEEGASKEGEEDASKEGKEDASKEGEEDASKEEKEGSPKDGEEEPETPKEGEGETETPKEPVDVTCSVIQCIEGSVINTGGDTGVDLYVCMKVNKEKQETTEETVNDENKEKIEKDEEEEEEEEFEWIAKECDSGNFLKKSNGNYECEEDKEDIKEEYIEKPNNEKTSTDKTAPKTTTSKTTTSVIATVTENVPTTTTEGKTTKVTATNEETGTTKKTITESKTAKETGDNKTTTTKKNEATNTAKASSSPTTTTTKPPTGSGASLRSVPSLALYIILFIFAYLVQY